MTIPQPRPNIDDQHQRQLDLEREMQGMGKARDICAMRENKKAFIKNFGLLLAMASLLLVTGCDDKQKEHAGSQEPKLSTAFFSQVAGTLRAGLQRVRKKAQEPDLDIKKIKFFKPGDATYDDASVYELFSPNGGQVSPLLGQRIETYGPNPINGQSRLYISIGNKINKAGSEMSDVVIVITDVTEQACIQINEELNQLNEKGIKEQEVNLSPVSQDVNLDEIITLDSEKACVKTRNGYVYYEILEAR